MNIFCQQNFGNYFACLFLTHKDYRVGLGGWNHKPVPLQLPHCWLTGGDLDRNIELRCVRGLQSVCDGLVSVLKMDEIFPNLSLQVGQVVAGLIPPDPPKG